MMGPFKCSPCNKTFKKPSHWTRHLQTAKHSQKSLSCPHCDTVFTRSDALQSHIRTQHLKNSEHQCPHCGKQCASKYQLSQHVLIHSDARPLKCPHCPSRFRYSQQLKQHINRHEGIKPYKCSECSKSFTCSSELVTHRLNHTGEKPYQCSKCPKMFSQHSHLVAHQRVHSGARPYKCSQCSRAFRQSSHLKIHESSHLGVKPFECKECGEKFRLPHTLKSHMRRHTGEKPYKCPHCPAAFSQSTPRKYHMEKIHGNAYQRCPQEDCFKTFPSLPQMKAHLKTHQNANGFSCIFCNATSRTRNDLYKHLRVHIQERPVSDKTYDDCANMPGKKTFPQSIHLESPGNPPNEIVTVGIHKKKISLQSKVYGVKTRHQNHLNRHMNIHKNKKKSVLIDEIVPSSDVLELETELGAPLVTVEDDEMEFDLTATAVEVETAEIEILETKHVTLKMMPALSSGSPEAAVLPEGMEMDSFEIEEDIIEESELKIESVRHVAPEELQLINKFRRYQCDHCNKMYKTVGELERHAVMHIVVSGPGVQKSGGNSSKPPKLPIKKMDTGNVSNKNVKKKVKKKRIMSRDEPPSATIKDAGIRAAEVSHKGINNKDKTKKINKKDVNNSVIDINNEDKTPEKKSRKAKPTDFDDAIPVPEPIQMSDIVDDYAKPDNPKISSSKLDSHTEAIPIPEPIQLSDILDDADLVTTPMSRVATMNTKKGDEKMPTLECSSLSIKTSETNKRRSTRQRNDMPTLVRMETTNAKVKVSQEKIKSPISIKVSCLYCKRKFGNKGGLGVHMKTAHPQTKSGSKTKSLPLPMKKMTTANETKNQKPASEGNKIYEPSAKTSALVFCPPLPVTSKLYKCILCKFRTMERESLTLHARQVHYRTNQHNCQSCWKSFPNESRLTEHVLNSHSSLQATTSQE